MGEEEISRKVSVVNERQISGKTVTVLVYASCVSVEKFRKGVDMKNIKPNAFGNVLHAGKNKVFRVDNSKIVNEDSALSEGAVMAFAPSFSSSERNKIAVNPVVRLDMSFVSAPTSSRFSAYPDDKAEELKREKERSKKNGIFYRGRVVIAGEEMDAHSRSNSMKMRPQRAYILYVPSSCAVVS